MVYMQTFPPLKLVDGTHLNSLQMDPTLLLDSVVLLYGARNTGKTTAVFEIMYQVKDLVDEVYVISQSAEANNQFAGYIPDNAIKTDIGTNWMESLIKRQKAKAHRMRKYVSNPEILESLFTKCARDHEKQAKLNFIHKTDDYIARVKQSYSNNYEMQMYETNKLEKSKTKRIDMLYKSTIKKNLQMLKNKESLTVGERTAVDHFNMNPHIMLIFDDCASAMKEWTRKNPGIIEAIYNGRHYFMTVIITAQADTTIDNKIRSNFTLVIYTDPGTAENNFNREHKADKKRGSKCIAGIWRKTNSKANFKKLIYLAAPSDGDPFRYCIVHIHNDFKVGSEAFWKMSKATEVQRNRSVQ